MPLCTNSLLALKFSTDICKNFHHLFNLFPSILSFFLQMLSSKDLNFVGYTYKNFELVNDDEVLEMGIVYFPLSTKNFVCPFHCCHLFLL